MTSSRPRRWFAFILLLAALAGSWAIIWRGGAARLQAAIVDSIAHMEAKGARAACEDLSIGGFPAAMRLDCAATAYVRDLDGVSVKSGPLSIGWSLIAPLTVTGALTGPAHAELPGLVPLDLTWESLVGESRLALPRPSRARFSAIGLKGTNDSSGSPQDVVAVGALAGEGTIDGADLLIALDADDARIAPSFLGGRDLPPLAMTLRATIRNGVAQVLRRRPSLRGTSIDVTGLRLSPGGDAGIRVDGVLTIDTAGALDGKLTAHIDDAVAVADFLKKALPGEADQVAIGVDAIVAMESPPGSGAGVPVRFEKGAAYLGFLPLGFVPPLP